MVRAGTPVDFDIIARAWGGFECTLSNTQASDASRLREGKGSGGGGGDGGGGGSGRLDRATVFRAVLEPVSTFVSSPARITVSSRGSPVGTRSSPSSSSFSSSHQALPVSLPAIPVVVDSRGDGLYRGRYVLRNTGSYSLKVWTVPAAGNAVPTGDKAGGKATSMSASNGRSMVSGMPMRVVVQPGDPDPARCRCLAAPEPMRSNVGSSGATAEFTDLVNHSKRGSRPYTIQWPSRRPSLHGQRGRNDGKISVRTGASGDQRVVTFHVHVSDFYGNVYGNAVGPIAGVTPGGTPTGITGVTGGSESGSMSGSTSGSMSGSIRGSQQRHPAPPPLKVEVKGGAWHHPQGTSEGKDHLALTDIMYDEALACFVVRWDLGEHWSAAGGGEGGGGGGGGEAGRVIDCSLSVSVHQPTRVGSGNNRRGTGVAGRGKQEAVVREVPIRGSPFNIQINGWGGGGTTASTTTDMVGTTTTSGTTDTDDEKRRSGAARGQLELPAESKADPSSSMPSEGEIEPYSSDACERHPLCPNNHATTRRFHLERRIDTGATLHGVPLIGSQRGHQHGPFVFWMQLGDSHEPPTARTRNGIQQSRAAFYAMHSSALPGLLSSGCSTGCCCADIRQAMGQERKEERKEESVNAATLSPLGVGGERVDSEHDVARNGGNRSTASPDRYWVGLPIVVHATSGKGSSADRVLDRLLVGARGIVGPMVRALKGTLTSTTAPPSPPSPSRRHAPLGGGVSTAVVRVLAAVVADATGGSLSCRCGREEEREAGRSLQQSPSSPSSPPSQWSDLLSGTHCSCYTVFADITTPSTFTEETDPSSPPSSSQVTSASGSGGGQGKAPFHSVLLGDLIEGLRIVRVDDHSAAGAGTPSGSSAAFTSRRVLLSLRQLGDIRAVLLKLLCDQVALSVALRPTTLGSFGAVVIDGGSGGNGAEGAEGEGGGSFVDLLHFPHDLIPPLPPFQGERNGATSASKRRKNK